MYLWISVATPFYLSFPLLSNAADVGLDEHRVEPPPYCNTELLSGVEAFMVDLDGTMYGDLSPKSTGVNALIEGAIFFQSYLREANIPLVYLSNSGAKGAGGVNYKFAALGMPDAAGGSDHVWTAADGIASFLSKRAPPGSRIFVIESEFRLGTEVDSCSRVINRRVPEPLPWDLRVFLNDDEAKAWSANAARGEPVFVAYCSDNATAANGVELMTRASWLLNNGATLVGASNDAFAPGWDPAFPDLRLWLPGPGPSLSWLRRAGGLHGSSRMRVIGKGGNEDNDFMFSEAMQLLKQQVGDPDFALLPDQVAMVGDTLDTDIAGGLRFGTKTVFLTNTGFDSLDDLQYHPGVRPTCHLPSIKELAVLISEARMGANSADDLGLISLID